MPISDNSAWGNFITGNTFASSTTVTNASGIYVNPVPEPRKESPDEWLRRRVEEVLWAA